MAYFLVVWAMAYFESYFMLGKNFEMKSYVGNFMKEFVAESLKKPFANTIMAQDY